jgi:uncharacterized membrane protein YbhN (UPF0104 family)/tRNA A-37 threonylcarbamoyl transferase component Bud32
MTASPGERTAAVAGTSLPAGRWPRLFAGPADEPRSRRASDVILLLGSLAGLAVLGVVAAPPAGIVRAFMAFVARIPASFDALWRLQIALPAVYAGLVVVGTVLRRRWAVLRDLVLAVVIALGVALTIGFGSTGSWPAVWDSLRSLGPAVYFPPMRLATSAAIVVTASPHLTKPARRIGRWTVVLGLFGTVLHQVATPGGAVAAVLTASVGAAVVHLIFGSSMGRPSLADVASSLTGLGIGAHSLGAAQRQPAGVFVVDARDDADQPLIVKVYGRDAHDTQLVSTVWRTVWYREAGSPAALGRLQQAEHEAFLTLLAAQHGIHTSRIITATATPGNDVVLVMSRVGETFEALPDVWTDGVAAEAWQVLARLHELGIAHGQLDDQHLTMHAGGVGLADFRGATATPKPEQLRTDEAQLLTATALGIGAEASCVVALTALGSAGVAALLPFLQPAVLPAVQRAQVRKSGLDLDKLRAQAAELAETPAPELQQLRRVTLGSVIKVVLPIVAFFALAAGLGELDFELLGEQLRDASWWFVGIAAVIAQLPRVADAVSVMGASPTVLPLGPVYALQLATSYLSLAVPTIAARVAINIRFFQRHGLKAGSAIAIGALDGFFQFAVEIVLLLSILLLTPVSLDLQLDAGVSGKLTSLVAIVAVVGLAAVLTVFLVAKWRRLIVGWIRRLMGEALQAVRGLGSLRRLSLLIGGNLASQLLFALALQTFVRSLGYHVGLAELVVINISVSLLSGIMPIPGGIGVVEGGLIFGLTHAGVPDEVAFAAVLLYRLATFYLPPVWGFFALRWLERNRYL